MENNQHKNIYIEKYSLHCTLEKFKDWLRSLLSHSKNLKCNRIYNSN